MALPTFAQEPAGTRSRSRAIRTTGAIAIAAAAVGAVLFWGATAQATAAAATTVVTPTPTQPPGDNATDCNTGQNPAGLSGSIILSSDDDPAGLNGSRTGVGQGTVDVDQKVLTVHLEAGTTASGVVVKGGAGFNVYFGPFVGDITIAGMVSPLVGQDKNIPVISHWFVCGTTTTTTTTTTETTGTSSSTSSTSTDGTTPGTPGTSTTNTSGNLPVTGTAIGGIVLAGVLLIGGGAALLFFRRRRDAAGAS